MKIIWNTTWLLFGLFATSCGSTQDSNAPTRAYGSTSQPALSRAAVDDEDDGDEALTPDQVPAAVRAAAQKALPGFVIVAAERETENGAVQYALEGTVNGVSKEIEVSADGQTVEIESGDDDDDDDSDDEDD